MTTYPRPLDALTDTSFRGRWNRHRRIVIPALVALLAVAAFLAWGPIGLGNGPLQVGQHGAEGWADIADAPAAMPLPISYSGHNPAVIDGVDVVGGTNYPAPRIVALEILAIDPSCSGLWAARPAPGGFVEAGCHGSVRGRLLGSWLGAQNELSPGLAAMAEFAAPHPGTCWAFTKIAVHYHIGTKHFTATGPAEYAVCATRSMGFVHSAMNAVDGT